jgi:[acyl-carrier-protein] S-malonyltransferase
MLAWLPPDAEPLGQLVQAFGPDWRGRLRDAGWSARNEVAQPVLTAVVLAAWGALAPKLGAPIVVAGYSVGELAASCVAGVLSVEESMDLAWQRGRLMGDLAEHNPGGLLSVRACPSARLSRVCGESGVLPAIMFGGEDAIVGGPELALQRAEALLAASGVDSRRLQVNVPSHTAFMAPMSAQWAQAVLDLHAQSPRWPMVLNATAGAAWRGADVQQALIQQVVTPIHWPNCLAQVKERGVRCVLEVGPGTTLSKTWRRAYPDVPVRSVDEFAGVAGIARWVSGVLGS